MSSLLLISAVKEDLPFATALAAHVDCQLLHTTDIKEGVALFKEKSPQFLLVDGSTKAIFKELEDELHDKVGLFSEAIQSNFIHLIASAPLDQVPYLTQSPIFGHLIYRKFNEYKKSAKLYSRILNASKKERAFGLENLMAPGAKIQTVKLVSSDQKQSAVNAVVGYLTQAKFQPRIATLIGNAVDELLMNAIFDAPIDATGKHLFNNTPRTTVFKLEDKSSVEMQICFDGEYIGVTAIDHYGSVNKTKLLAHTSKSYTDAEYSIKTGQAGAGIGLATIYQNGGSLLFSSSAGERTEATIFFRRTESFVEFRNQFRFFSTQFYF